MICSLTLDPDDSVDFPDNTATALGRSISAYPLMAARSCGRIRRNFVLTGSQPVKSAALQNAAVILDPPAPAEAPPGASYASELLRHGYRIILDEAKEEREELELLVVFFAHAPAVTAQDLEAGVEALQGRPELDSALSVSPFNRWNPFYARRETSEGSLEPYVPHAPDARGDVWYPNWGIQVLRPRCLEAAFGGETRPAGHPLFPWLGRKVWPIKQWGGGILDYKWQLPAIEFWLKKHGFADITPTLELQPKPQPAPKARP